MMLSGTSRRNYDSLQTLWSSLLPMSTISEIQSDDEEIVKLSLLLKSTQLLVTELRQKQLSAAGQFQSTADELKSAMGKMKQFQSETKALQKDLSMVKFELQSAEAKAKKFQKEADTANEKCERLQSKIASEVEARLHNMFKNCLQQNKAATVFDMMTQMYQDTQTPDAAECQYRRNPAAEPVAKRLQASELPSEKQSKRAKMSTRYRISDEASPDTSVVFATPEAQKRKNLISRKNGLVQPKFPPHSVPSSPDEIAGTPPSAIERKNNRKKENTRKFPNSDVQVSNIVDAVEKNSLVYALDTQDVDEAPTTLRSVLKDNICIPPTLDPDDCDEEKETICSTERNKENKKTLAGCNNQQRKLVPNRSTNVEYPSTPPKKLKSREEGSPILGNSSGSKSSSRPPNTASSANVSYDLSKKCQSKSSSFQAVSSAVSYRMTSNGKCKKSVQQSITSFASNLSKSNRSNHKLSLRKDSLLGDASKYLDFNDTKTIETELSVPHLSEREQIEMAISNSMKENYVQSHPDDSDTTLYVPSGSYPKNNELDQEIMKPPAIPNPVDKNKHCQKDNSDNFFEPMCASTAREDVTPTKQKYPTNSSGGMPSATQFNPPFASTEKVLTENSALHDLTALLDAQALDNTARYLPDTSYDHLPKKSTSPAYKYKGAPVRKKNERKNLPALECTQCGQYFAAAFDSDDQDAKKIMVNSCSRHRDRNGPRPSTPKQYWDPGWTSPATEVKKCQEMTPV